MYTDIDSKSRLSINDLTEHQGEIIAVALARIVEQLPLIDQPSFRGLLIQLDRLLTEIRK